LQLWNEDALRIAASGFNLCRGFLARHRRRRFGEDKDFSGERPGPAGGTD